MSYSIKISIFVITLKIISSTYLRAESNYLKPLLERNNIINKGVWVRNPKDKFVEPSNTGDFLFRTNSLDVDNILQNNFDAFGDDDMQDSPGIFGYHERTKRSTSLERKNLLQQNMKECEGYKDCLLKTIKEKSYVKSKLMSKLKPASVFNDYPYEVAILLGDNKLEASNKIRKVKESGDIDTVIPLNGNIEISNLNEELVTTEYKPDSVNLNIINNSYVTPKRSMKNEFESEVIKKIEITEDLRNENGSMKFDRGIFDKDERVWHQNLPDNSYKVNAAYPKNKLINERGLLKVLSMLTKTFKKIMKQHNDIRKIHSKLHNINDEVNRNIIDVTKKYQDIEEKYAAILAVNKKMKDFEANMNSKDEYFRNKDREMAKNMAEFENQQKKFLTQQRQFYNIQKLMLAQNEKINIKQNLIAKTQSEISHRQNNFARILKKAKQIYIDNKFNANKTPTSTEKPINDTEETAKITHTTTSSPYTTESIKINLFSIPAFNKLVNQDIQILKEKDEQPVDDLVYKYYFNNTFIDNLMKSKVLSSFVTTAENTEIARNAKNKRHRNELETTVLLPINTNKSDNSGKLNRERRWIRHRHQSKSKLKKTNNNKVPNQFNDGKPIRPTEMHLKNDNSVTKLFAKDKNSPFLIMAKSFCNEIGQNVNDQMLNWCVEKSLRRLQFIDSKIPFIPSPLPEPPKSPGGEDQKTKVPMTRQDVTQSPSNPMVSESTIPVTSSSPPLTITPILMTDSTQPTLVFFPDNDELESNLKEFDLKPDTEGNFYYDGSLHASDLGLIENSDALSDIIPGLESNSKVQVDSLAFDLQSRRRDTVRRINADLIKKLYG